MKITQEQFEKKCYDAYQLDWMISHGHSLNEYRHLLTSLAGMTLEENPLDIPSNENDMETLITEAEDTFQDTGFASGCLFAWMNFSAQNISIQIIWIIFCQICLTVKTAKHSGKNLQD